MIKDENEIDVNKCLNFIKNNIDFTRFNISKIDINTRLPYYIIKVVYLNKNTDHKQLFSEYIIDKYNNNIIHYFSSPTIKDEEYYIEIIKENFTFKHILKIFHYKNEWITISENDKFENYIKKTFNNKDDLFEILNKEFYYTYIIDNEKLIFISKSKTNDTNQFYNSVFKDILFENNNYVFLKNKNTEKDKIKECKYGVKCINPLCNYKHPKEYNLYESYIEYINNEKNKNYRFKSTYCKYEDGLCEKHKYNKCIFKHNNDPID